MIIENINEFTIYEVEKLKDIFLQELKKDKNLDLDMSLIQKIDMVGIQLLISAYKSFKNINKTINFKNINNNILNEIKLVNCTSALGLDNG